MPGPAAITCPHCASSLKLKDRSKLGQKITCPKCKKPFKAQEQVDDEDEFAGLVARDREADDDEELPPPRRAAPARRPATKGKARGKSSGSKLPLIIGGAVGLVVFVGVGLAIQHFMGGGGQPSNPVAGPEPAAGGPAGAPVAAQAPPVAPAKKKIDFSWLPAQSEAVVYVRPADLLKSPFAQWVIDAAGGRDQVNQGQEKMRQEVGVGFDDIESITIGIKSLGELAAGAADIAPGGMPNPLQAASGLSKLREKEIVGVARLSKPVDLPKNPQFQQQTEAVTHNSATYYRDKSLNGQQPSSFTYFPSPTLVVISGREDVLKGLMDRQGKAEPRAELEIVDPDQHFAFAFLVKPELAGGPPGNAPGIADPLATFKKVQSGCIGIKATDGLELSVWQSCPDAKTAEEVQAATDGLLAQGKEQLSQLKGTMPKNLGQLGETLLASVKTSRRERVVETAASLPASSRDNLKAMPGELLAAVLMGGLGGGGNAPGGAGPFSNSFSGAGDAGEFKGEAVVVEKLAGLPEGVTLQGRGGWSNVQLFEQDGKTPLPRLLTFEVDYLGGAAAQAVEYGAIRVTQLAVEPSQRLKLADRPGSFGEASPFKEFVDVKHREFVTDHPEDGVRVGIHFERPGVPPAKFTSVEGSVTLRIAGETKEILVPKLLEQVGKTPADPDLKAAGFAVSTKTEEGQKTLTLTFARGAKVADVKLVGADGEPLANAPFLLRLDLFGTTRFGGSLAGGLLGGNAPAGMGARVILQTKISEVSVPFRFENVSIPAPPDVAAATSSAWKPSTAKSKVPDEVSVEGRLKWGHAFSFDGKTAPPEIELDVDVTGPRMLHVVGVGFQRIDKADTNTAGTLTAKKANLLFGGDRTKQFSRVERSSFMHHHPPDGVQVVLGFEPVQQAFTKLDYVAGTFKLLVARERKKTILDKLASRVGKTVSNADLRAAGLDIKVTKQDESLSFQVAKGNAFAMGDAALIRESSDGFDLPLFMYDPFTKSGTIFLGGDKLKPNDALEVTYYTGLSEIEIPFIFEDLAVPPLPKPAAK